MLLGTLKKDREIKALLHCADNQLDAMGYTEHSFRHVSIVCQRVEKILAAVGCDEKEIEIGKIAGFLHDLGNCVNRKDHAHSGAILAYTLLVKKGMNYADAARVMEAIGNHDEETGQVASKLSAALILADKSDVHRTRVRKLKISQDGLVDKDDIHDRVNYAVVMSDIAIDKDAGQIKFLFQIDTGIYTAMDYFEIFLDRMKMCKKAAEYLGFEFMLEINDYRLA